MQGSKLSEHKERRGDGGHREHAEKIRLNNWLWLFLNNERDERDKFPADSLAREDVRDYLENKSGEMKVRSTLITQVGHYLLPIEDLTWIDGSDRQANWLESYLDKVLNTRVRPRPPNLFGKNLIIALVDLCELKLQEKAHSVKKMKEDWNEHQNNDVIFKWFKGRDERPRCELAWNWLRDNKGSQTYGCAPISSCEQLLIFYDKLTDNISGKKFDVAAIKKRWSQQEYRKNLVGKKQYNFVLSNQSIKKLDKLAAKYELSRPQILEALINFESENSSYLPEMLKKRWELS